METSQVSDEAKESMVKDLEEASQTDNPVTEVLRPLSRFTAAVPQGTPASSSGGVLPVPEKAAQKPLLGNTDEVLSGVREGSVALGEPSPSVLTSTGRPGDVVGSVTDVSKPAVELPAITTHGEPGVLSSTEPAQKGSISGEPKSNTKAHTTSKGVTQRVAPTDDGTVSTTPAAPWAPEDHTLIASLHAAAWKVVDVETTELTPGSPPLKATSVHGLTAWQKSQVNTQPRLRIVTATWPTDAGLRTESWDMDTLSADARQRLAAASLTGVFVAHNAAFDLLWLIHAAGGLAEAPRPERVIDTLIFARTWSPDQQAALADAAEQETAESELAEVVGTMLGDGRKGGWSLEALVMAHLHKTLDKTLQKPRNWLPPPPLSDAHYQYAAGDSTELLELICVLLAGLGFDVAEPAGWLEAYEAWVAEEIRRAGKNIEPLAPGFDGGAEQLPATDLIALYEQVPWLLAAMSSRGTPADVARKDAYVESQKVAAREAAAQVGV